MIVSLNPLHITLLSLLVVFTAIQLWYWLGFFRKAAFAAAPEAGEADSLPPLSVIICARNEAKNLRMFLPDVLEQDYPGYEVIVVNDCSDDETDDVLGEMLAKYRHLRVSSIQKDPGFTHAKKLAMLVGIKASHNEMLVFTDADCRPVSDKWLRNVAAAYADSADIVIGYGGYSKAPGLLNRYVRYETLFVALQYFGMALKGHPYMGVGRNLAYRRSFFFSRGGFGPHNHIMSGDDDLFVNRNAKDRNYNTMLSPESFTISLPPASLSEWAKQKRRHLTTAKYYKSEDRIRLFTEPFTRVAYYALLTALAITTAFWPFLIFIALLRLTVRGIVMSKGQKTFSEKGIWFLSLFFDILAPFVSTFLYLSRTRKGRGLEAWK